MNTKKTSKKNTKKNTTKNEFWNEFKEILRSDEMKKWFSESIGKEMHQPP